MADDIWETAALPEDIVMGNSWESFQTQDELLGRLMAACRSVCAQENVCVLKKAMRARMRQVFRNKRRQLQIHANPELLERKKLASKAARITYVSGSGQCFSGRVIFTLVLCKQLMK